MKTKLFCLLAFVVLVTGFVSCTPTEDQQIPFTVTYGAASEFSKDYAIPDLSPTLTNGSATSYSITPALSAGLTLNTTTGVISGTPTANAATTSYVVTATGPDGSASSHVVITVSDLGPLLIVKFKFDPNQVRLNNFGNPSVVASGNAAQSPIF
ncbi:MAG TPA: putative Ig domain-containing protein, partial [Flavobacterium sp.]|nr:putative Ig domain-containing protein [Flavobacterium sp.]